MAGPSGKCVYSYVPLVPPTHGKCKAEMEKNYWVNDDDDDDDLQDTLLDSKMAVPTSLYNSPVSKINEESVCKDDIRNYMTSMSDDVVDDEETRLTNIRDPEAVTTEINGCPDNIQNNKAPMPGGKKTRLANIRNPPISKEISDHNFNRLPQAAIIECVDLVSDDEHFVDDAADRVSQQVEDELLQDKPTVQSSSKSERSGLKRSLVKDTPPAKKKKASEKLIVSSHLVAKISKTSDGRLDVLTPPPDEENNIPDLGSHKNKKKPKKSSSKWKRPREGIQPSVREVIQPSVIPIQISSHLGTQNFSVPNIAMNYSELMETKEGRQKLRELAATLDAIEEEPQIAEPVTAVKNTMSRDTPLKTVPQTAITPIKLGQLLARSLCSPEVPAPRAALKAAFYPTLSSSSPEPLHQSEMPNQMSMPSNSYVNGHKGHAPRKQNTKQPTKNISQKGLHSTPRMEFSPSQPSVSQLNNASASTHSNKTPHRLNQFPPGFNIPSTQKSNNMSGSSSSVNYLVETNRTAQWSDPSFLNQSRLGFPPQLGNTSNGMQQSQRLNGHLPDLGYRNEWYNGPGGMKQPLPYHTTNMPANSPLIQGIRGIYQQPPAYNTNRTSGLVSSGLQNHQTRKSHSVQAYLNLSGSTTNDNVQASFQAQYTQPQMHFIPGLQMPNNVYYRRQNQTGSRFQVPNNSNGQQYLSQQQNPLNQSIYN